MHIYLGGSDISHSSDASWRNELTSMISTSLFPSTPNYDLDLTSQAYRTEIRSLNSIKVHCFTPKPFSLLAITDLLEDAHTCPKSTIFILLDHDGCKTWGDDHSFKELVAIGKLVKELGCHVFFHLDAAAEFVNSIVKEKKYNKLKANKS